MCWLINSQQFGHLKRKVFGVKHLRFWTTRFYLLQLRKKFPNSFSQFPSEAERQPLQSMIPVPFKRNSILFLAYWHNPSAFSNQTDSKTNAFCLPGGKLSEEEVCIGPVLDSKQLVTVVICGVILVTNYKYRSSVSLIVAIVYLFALKWIEPWLA